MLKDSAYCFDQILEATFSYGLLHMDSPVFADQ